MGKEEIVKAEGRPAKVQRVEATQTAATTPAAATTTTPAAAAPAPSVATIDTSNSSNNSNNSAAPVKQHLENDSPKASSSSKEDVEAAWAETEHKNWEVNTRVLYDVILSIPLDWPSLTVQWLPGTTPGAGSSTVKQRLLVGTHTSGAEPDALLVMQVELPTEPIEDGQGNEYKERGDYEGFHFGLSSYKVKLVKRLPHPQESNCARYMPQRPSIIASCAVDGRVLLYDLDAAGICEGPEAFLVSHKGEATCLSWNPYREGCVASCGSMGSLVVHDATVARTKVEGDPKALFLAQQASGFNSCCWARADILIGAAEDGIVALWDTRIDPTKPIGQVSCDGKAANCVAASHLKNDLFLCGADDGVLRLFDRRRLPFAVHEMEGHRQSKVSVVSFSQHESSLILSGGYDKFLSLWDLNRIGADQDPDDAEDGPPELLFTHGGHCSDIYDAAWNSEEKFSQMVASVADDNKLHIWQPKTSVFFDDEGGEREGDEEEVELE